MATGPQKVSNDLQPNPSLIVLDTTVVAFRGFVLSCIVYFLVFEDACRLKYMTIAKISFLLSPVNHLCLRFLDNALYQALLSGSFSRFGIRHAVFCVR